MRPVLPILLLLGGCAHFWPATMVVCPELPKIEPQKPAPPAPAGAPAASAAEAHTASVVKDYKAQVQREVDVITAPSVTPDLVRQVLAADRAARRALLRLEAEGRHPQPNTLQAARGAVKHLGDVLAAVPGDEH